MQQLSDIPTFPLSERNRPIWCFSVLICLLPSRHVCCAFFRKGIDLLVPPFRDRHEDILLLANSILPQDRRSSDDATIALLAHSWPGDVRELHELISATAPLDDSEKISTQDQGLSPSRPDVNSSAITKFSSSLPNNRCVFPGGNFPEASLGLPEEGDCRKSS